MIWDRAETEGDLILNTTWPQRHLYYVTDPDGPDHSAYVWADCFGDAVETLAECNNHEGDDDRIDGREVVDADEYERIKRATDDANNKR